MTGSQPNPFNLDCLWLVTLMMAWERWFSFWNIWWNACFIIAVNERTLSLTLWDSYKISISICVETETFWVCFMLLVHDYIRVLFLHLITIVGREWRITKDTIARDNPVSYSQLLYKNWDTCVHPLHTHRSWLLLSLGPGGDLLLQSSSHCWTL